MHVRSTDIAVVFGVFLIGCSASTGQTAQGEARDRNTLQQSQQKQALAASQSGDTGHRESTATPANAPQIEGSSPNFAVANTAIDEAFRSWSSSWMIDRYIAGSARIAERDVANGTVVIRGMFDFMRGTNRFTIPFAAAFTSNSNTFRLSNLCYNDSSSGMTDCIDPSDRSQHLAAQSRQFLGAIVVLGLVAAMASSVGDNDGASGGNDTDSRDHSDPAKALARQRWSNQFDKWSRGEGPHPVTGEMRGASGP